MVKMNMFTNILTHFVFFMDLMRLITVEFNMNLKNVSCA